MVNKIYILFLLLLIHSICLCDSATVVHPNLNMDLIGESTNRKLLYNNWTSCPTGFSWPTQFEIEQRKKDIWTIEDPSGCALNCIIPMYSASEWKTIEQSYTLTLWIGLILVSAMLVTWFFDPLKRSQYLVLIFALLSFLECAIGVVVQKQEKTLKIGFVIVYLL